MDETTLDWDNWRLFLAIARERGLAGASRATGKSAPTLGRRMLLLEKNTGKELFTRLPRGYELTEEGQKIFEEISILESKLLSLSDSDSETALVKVSAGSWMTYGLCKNIKQITQTTSGVRLRFLAAESVLDISRRETTIGIRNDRPTQENLVCRKIGRVHFAGYSMKRNTEDWILVDQNTPSAQWLRTKTDDNALIQVNSPRNALDLISAGIGRAVLPTFIGDETKKLLRITPNLSELSHDQWLVTHPREQYQPSVRKVIDGIYHVAKLLHKK